MDGERLFIYPRHGICTDADKLKSRGISKLAFDDGISAENPKVVRACEDCPVQVDCFDEAVDSIRRHLPILGVRAGLSATDIGKMVYHSKPESPQARRYKLEVSQTMARQALSASMQTATS